MNMESFVFALLVVSSLTGLVTEAVKKVLTEHNIKYYSNTLTGICSCVVSLCMSVFYITYNELTFDGKTITTTLTLIFLSWLCAMTGYDKVVQTLTQFKKG